MSASDKSNPPKLNIPASRLRSSSNVKESSSVMDFLNKDIKLFGSGLNNKKKFNFYTDIHILLSSGIDMKTSLELIVDEARKNEKVLYTQIKDAVINGKSLSDALSQTGKFSTYEEYSVRIGEETGRLIEVLQDIFFYFNRRIEQKRKIINVFTYPIIVFSTALAAVIFMMNFIIPMFEDVFKRFGNQELPMLTQIIIKLSKGFSTYFPYFLVFIITLIVFAYQSRKKLWYRKRVSYFSIRLPLFGDIIRKIYLTRFCMSLELLTGARIPLIQAIQLLKKMIGFYPLESALDSVEKDIMKGISLNQSLSKFKIFDKRMLNLIKVAEEVNQLNTVFGKLKDQYSADVDYKTNTLSSILEPFIIIFVGLFVGIILISMYLPMFQLSTSFGT